VRIVSHGGLGCDGAPDGSGWQTGGGLYAEPLDEASGQSGSGRRSRSCWPERGIECWMRVRCRNYFSGTQEGFVRMVTDPGVAYRCIRSNCRPSISFTRNQFRRFCPSGKALATVFSPVYWP
jgi:hypothetical protein